MTNLPELKPKGFLPPEFNLAKKPDAAVSKEQPASGETNAGAAIETVIPTETPKEAAAQTEEVGAIEKTLGGLRQMLVGAKTASTAVPIVRDDVMTRVEKIMEEDLADTFASLPPVKKQEFKIKGEETAYKISELLKKGKVKIKKIFKLILEWLMVLPGINRFYLEQEAKIKADKILALKKMADNKK